MRRLLGTLFVLMLVVAMLAIPSAVAAGSIAQDCTFEKLKWQDNPSSWYLYLNNWGRTPPSAMSRLAGLKITAFGHTANKNADCGKAAVSTCADCAQVGGLWGTSTCFANKSWAADDIGTNPRINNAHPNHRGSVKCDPKLAGKGEPCGSLVCANGPCKALSGGDWGISGCPHPQCAGDTWCYTDNLATGK